MGIAEIIAAVVIFAAGYGLAVFISRSGKQLLEERISFLNEQNEKLSNREQEL